MHRYIRSVLGIVFGAALIFGIAEAETPTQVVAATADRVISILQDKVLSADVRDAALKELLETHFDLHYISRAVLPEKYWPPLTVAQHEVFAALFSEFMRKNFIPLISPDNFKVIFVNEHAPKAQQLSPEMPALCVDICEVVMAVTTRVMGDIKTIPVIVTLTKTGDGGWQITDLNFEVEKMLVEFIAYNRVQYTRLAKKGMTFKELLHHLRDAIKK